MRLFLRFVIPLFLAIGIIAYALVPLVDKLVVQWFVNDLDLRSKLISSTVDDSIFDVLDERSKTKIQSFFDRVKQDERMYALGFCDAKGRLSYQSGEFPADITCPGAGSGILANQVIQEPNGPLHVAFHTVQGSGRVLGHLALVHDMSFVQRRSSATKHYILYVFIIVSIIVAAVTTLIAWLSWRGWISGTRALLRSNRLRHPMAGTRPELQPIVRDLRELIRDLETDRRLRDDSQTTWTPRAIKELLHKELSGDEVIVVSNREPYIHVKRDDHIEVQVPASGLVTALEPIMRACSGTWVAHGSGSADRDVVDAHDHVAVPPDHPAYRIRRVWLTEEEEAGYYYGFSNEGLWPLCHIAHVRPIFRTTDWERYKQVNEKFAKAILEEVKTDDPVILVQDYLLALLPRMLREKLPNATIITFWHIPWPNPEAFGICPWTEEILDGLLGSSIVGFHTRQHDMNFVGTVERFLECRVDRASWTISYGGELCAVNHYPISIEFPTRLLRQAKPVSGSRTVICKQYGLAKDSLLGIGVDRLDYTKGIAEKFLAVERLLELHPEWLGRFTFVQVAAPSRSRIGRYRELAAEVRCVADRINQRFGSDLYKPVILHMQHCEAHDVLDHYRAADLCFVNSLHDGMNLVAKEFVAARDDEQGVLLLSKFTGTAREFPEALIVNPYHLDQCAEALHAALIMSPEEQRDRMRSLRGVLHEFNVYRWAGRMLMDAARMRQRRRFLSRVAATDWDTTSQP